MIAIVKYFLYLSSSSSLSLSPSSPSYFGSLADLTISNDLSAIAPSSTALLLYCKNLLSPSPLLMKLTLTYTVKFPVKVELYAKNKVFSPSYKIKIRT